MSLELFDDNDTVFALHEVESEMCIEVDDNYFYANEEQALQIAAHLQRWVASQRARREQ